MTECSIETQLEMHKNNAEYYRQLADNYGYHIELLEQRIAEYKAKEEKLWKKILEIMSQKSGTENTSSGDLK